MQSNTSQLSFEYKFKCTCEKPEPELRNYSAMWHDGEIYCQKCNYFIRHFDAG